MDAPGTWPFRTFFKRCRPLCVSRGRGSVCLVCGEEILFEFGMEIRRQLAMFCRMSLVVSAIDSEVPLNVFISVSNICS